MIIDDLRKKQIEFLKSGDTFRLDVLRYFLSQVKNKEIELRPQNQPLTDEISFKVLRKQIKDRKESIDLYQKGNRPDLVEKETKELGVLQEFAKLFPFDLNLEPQQNFQRK
jgi:uncharacterized protein YqeY